MGTEGWSHIPIVLIEPLNYLGKNGLVWGVKKTPKFMQFRNGSLNDKTSYQGQSESSMTQNIEAIAGSIGTWCTDIIVIL